MTRFLITFFLGMFGVHKFMDGNKKWGFIYLFTMGLFGLGWMYDTFVAFIDLVRDAPSRETELEIRNNNNELINLKSEIERNKITLASLNTEIEDKRNLIFNGLEEKLINEKETLNNSINDLSKLESSKTKQVKNLKSGLYVLQREVADLESFNDLQYFDYRYEDDEAAPSEIKNELALVKTQEKDLVRSIILNSDNTRTTVNVTLRELNRIILRLFESETEAHINDLTFRNLDQQRARIIRSYETINNLFKFAPVDIRQELLEFKLQKLVLNHEYDRRKLIASEEQKAIKEHMVEEAKAERELQQAEKKIERELMQFNRESKNLMEYLNKANSDAERNIYIDKIKELEEQIKQLQLDKDNIDERKLNTRAGYIYVISNIGSFGENIYKIGMTRRLEPMDRVKELASASVPFEFDVHAMIFSDDAPKLESTLHEHFKDHQVNKVNPRKEFFRVDLEEIEQVVKENHNATVTFTMTAKAEQYYETRRIEAKEIKVISKDGDILRT